MLAYAVDRRPASRPHLKTLSLIAAGHALALFAVMTARGDLPLVDDFGGTEVVFVDPPAPPPPPPKEPAHSEPTQSVIDRVEAEILMPSPLPIPVQPPAPVLQGSVAGEAVVPTPQLPVPPIRTELTRTTPKPLTSADDLIPPYPDEKLRLGEEAVIRLSLNIDSRGRVVAVSPVGRADPVFVDAARRHILRRWKYKPASENGTAVGSTLNVSIRFSLDG